MKKNHGQRKLRQCHCYLKWGSRVRSKTEQEMASRLKCLAFKVKTRSQDMRLHSHGRAVVEPNLCKAARGIFWLEPATKSTVLRAFNSHSAGLFCHCVARHSKKPAFIFAGYERSATVLHLTANRRVSNGSVFGPGYWALLNCWVVPGLLQTVNPVIIKNTKKYNSKLQKKYNNDEEKSSTI